ncbi:Paralemmin-3 [Sciurus carolinensis]|uniref:Paralemmin-3 n=1 Tax=Sciurus carolinensis TaxID=30640 RepID=A0AA41MPI7_SCICA|nr:Paralemmin-3 [Sciurus carolinensis]
MALQSQAWSPATPMPMAESSLYRQRLEVIAEKRRLQEEIRAARRELEEEKLRVERLKRKSLRERWLMDGAAEGPEQPEDPDSKDPQSPEGQAQARIRNLEDSLFTLQSQLQLLQSASTGAQHKPSGRPTWRRQDRRPLSQPTMDAGPAGQSDLDKRASLPSGLVGGSPESPSEPKEEAAGVLPPQRQVPGAVVSSSEANGPYPGRSPTLEPELVLGAVAAEEAVVEAKGAGVVEVVWEGLRATEDSAMGTSGLELEAKVEEVVLEAIGDRRGTGSTKLPAWVKEDRGVVEVVWEGLGGPGPEAARPSSPGLQERLQGEASREGEGAPRGSPEGEGQGGPEGEEGSFIWVERAALSEDWEELLMDGLEGPAVSGREGGGAQAREAEVRRSAEDSLGAGAQDSEAKPGTGREAARNGGKAPQQPEERGGEGKVETGEEGAGEPVSVESKESPGSWRAEKERGGEEPEAEESVEDPSGAERKEVEGPLGTEEERGEEKQGTEKEVEEALRVEGKGGEEASEAERERGEEALGAERKGGEEASGAERKGGEEASEAERKGGEETLEAERKGGEASEAERKGGEEALGVQKTQGSEEELSSREQRESGERTGSEGEVSEAGATLGVKQEPMPEEGLQPLEKQEGPLEEEAVQLRAPAESQGPPGDATPLLTETPAPEQPTENQPLLQRERPSANPSAHPAPTYAPARQPEPAAPTEGEEASGPKQKTCQCCAVM